MTSLTSTLASSRAPRARLFRGLSILALFTLLSGAVFAQTAQTDPNATDTGNANGRRGRRGQNADQTGNNNGGGRGNFDPAQMQQQMMDRMKEQFGVTDDAEWKVITDRLAPVMELRRAAGGGGGGFGLRGGMGGPGGGRGGRGGGAASPEQDALRQAIQDKLPDAEIKSRLDRVREVRKANEEKLAKAQDDLRAVLSVRQEAMAVMYGLLP
jgi:hypothetical protein